MEVTTRGYTISHLTRDAISHFTRHAISNFTGFIIPHIARHSIFPLITRGISFTHLAGDSEQREYESRLAKSNGHGGLSKRGSATSNHR
jgi:hypothetical protein